jgi:hypothetical protein
MAENENETPLGELVSMGETAPDPRSSTESVPALSVSEVVANYRIGNSTLRKRLAAGELVGAYKVKAGTGEAWAIPITTLDAAGIVRKPADEMTADLMADPDEQAPDLTAAVVPDGKTMLDSETLVELVASLRGVLERDSRQLEAAQGDRNKAQVEAAEARARLEMLEAEVERERTRAEALAVELAEVRAAASRKRGWFRRG